MKKMIKRDENHSKKIEEFRRSKGINRKVHFETGGSLSSWRGLHKIEEDSSKESDRLACRGQYALDEDDYDFGPEDSWKTHLCEE